MGTMRNRVQRPIRPHKRSTARALVAVAAAGVLGLTLTAGPLAAQPRAGAKDDFRAAPKWRPWVEFGGYYGSDETGRGEGVLWTPLTQTPMSVFFAEARFKFFEEDAQEGNVALGHRRMLPSGWNIGAWGGFDVRDSTGGNTFWQLAGGLEALRADWDLRVNAYAPLSDAEGAPSLAEVRLQGNNIFMIGGEEVPLYGVDGEVGYRLFGTPERASGRRHELRVFGGGFWFDADEAIEEVAGPKARLEWRVEDAIGSLPGSRLTLEGEFSHDDVRDDRWEVGARLRIPFGGGAPAAALTPQERRMAEGLERDTDIVTAQSGQEPVSDAQTDVAFDRVAYVDTGDSVTATSTGAGDNTLIVANGDIDGSQQLQGNQTLQGGGSTIAVRGRHSGTAASFTAPGGGPTLANPGNNPNLTLLASNTHVAGLDIEGAGAGNTLNDGIEAGDGFDTVVIEQSGIADTGGFGVVFGDGNRNVTISDTQIATTGFQGIFFFSDNSDVTIVDTSITNADLDGIFFNNDNNNVTIADTTITDPDGFGIRFIDDNMVDIADTEITNAGSSGIFFEDGNTVEIAGTEIADATGAGIFFEGVTGDGNTVAIADTTITDPGGNGIVFTDDNTVDITNTMINNPGNNGIFFGDENTVDVAGTTITDSTFDGFLFVNDNTVDITDTTIDGADGHGINFGGGNDVSLNGSRLAGTFGNDGISISFANELSGDGNTAAGAVFGNFVPAGQFCDAAAGQIGSFAFDNRGAAMPSPGTCPSP